MHLENLAATSIGNATRFCRSYRQLSRAAQYENFVWEQPNQPRKSTSWLGCNKRTKRYNERYDMDFVRPINSCPNLLWIPPEAALSIIGAIVNFETISAIHDTFWRRGDPVGGRIDGYFCTSRVLPVSCHIAIVDADMPETPLRTITVPKPRPSRVRSYANSRRDTAVSERQRSANHI